MSATIESPYATYYWVMTFYLVPFRSSRR